jgi:VanZ family protein
MTFRTMLRFCSVAVIVVLVFVALGPERWQPRSGIGWEVDHFAGYFVITMMFLLAWPRPLLVGGALMAFAALLEGLQAFMPDRSA